MRWADLSYVDAADGLLILNWRGNAIGYLCLADIKYGVRSLREEHCVESDLSGIVMRGAVWWCSSIIRSRLADRRDFGLRKSTWLDRFDAGLRRGGGRPRRSLPSQPCL